MLWSIDFEDAKCVRAVTVVFVNMVFVLGFHKGVETHISRQGLILGGGGEISIQLPFFLISKRNIIFKGVLYMGTAACKDSQY